MDEFLLISKALSDATRVRALLTLVEGELCLCQVIQVLGLSPSTVSKHMNLLQQAGLVQRRKQGKWHFYRLTDTKPSPAVRKALAWVRQELRDDPVIAKDAAKVRRVRDEDLEKLSACYRL